MNVELHAKSDVGRVRRGNEDNFLVLELSKQQTWTGTDGSAALKELSNFELGQKGLVLVVSDGMGGALAGDVASRMAVDSVRDMILGTGSQEGCVCGKVTRSYSAAMGCRESCALKIFKILWPAIPISPGPVMN